VKLRIALGAVIFGLLTGSTGAQAFERTASMARSDFESQFGKALPPIGFVDFCARNPGDCRPAADARPDKLDMDTVRWNLLNRVNIYVNNKIAPVSDEDLYGQPEYWAYPNDAGDCEDYVLLKKRYLENLGFPADALLITVVRDEKNEGHAVLTVTAETGDIVLDNRRNDLLDWKGADYTFLKRQSARDPRVWISLVKDKTPTSPFVASGSQK
jgi:predicted transglutaminase-like cysteine proteinase